MSEPDINIDLKWFPENQAGVMKFEVCVLHGDERNTLNFQIRPSLLGAIERTQLVPSLEHHESIDVPAIAELLDVSLKQQRPELSSQDRNAELKRLLSSCWLVPSIKETAVQLEGRKLLWQTGYEDDYIRSKIVPHFSKIYQSQQIAARNLNFGTPKLKSASPADAEELELFFCELRHGDVAAAYQKHEALRGRLAKDESFLRAINKVILDREKPASFWFALKYQIVCAWTHAFLWGFKNAERPQVLFYFCGLPGLPMSDRQLAQMGEEQISVQQRQVPYEPGAVRKAIKEQGLLGYADFPKDYPRAPFSFRQEGHGDQLQVWIDFSALEQFESSSESREEE
jgi:hypothetical protein